MKRIYMYLFLIFASFLNLSKNTSSASLTIERSWPHGDKSGNYTPLVVTLSTEDVENKTKPIDLICVVDVSESMSEDNKIDYVKHSLEYLVNQSESIINNR